MSLLLPSSRLAAYAVSIWKKLDLHKSLLLGLGGRWPLTSWLVATICFLLLYSFYMPAFFSVFNANLIT